MSRSKDPDSLPEVRVTYFGYVTQRPSIIVVKSVEAECFVSELASGVVGCVLATGSVGPSVYELANRQE